MELSWSTFSLEVINFLILIWILKHFLYAPIQKTIVERKKTVQEQLTTAQTLHNEATQLQINYEHRLTDWQQEKTTLQSTLQEELEQWKAEEKLRFEHQLREEKEQVFAHEKQQLAALIEKKEREALLLAGKFAAKLVIDFADARLEEKIIAKTIEDLASFPIKQWQSMSAVSEEDSVCIQSAFPIKEQQRQHLIQAMEQFVPQKLSARFTENPTLLAGLTIQMGSVVLQANLRDELKFFTERKNGLV
ncbi:F-type H -transporting ATPase b chain [Legionella steelei]|uniref:ATP synthase subunit b n=2 Tax=Legionella TaxID=445 RepID=A0A0W0SAJ0_9GAMM|nr:MULTISPECIES: F0F1 ATP synthase subunit delta [Legionella]KTC80155.1 F-type H -transporting ATPase b chain [Legionella cherrii]KTD71747.1 F-type H -transporting ATPase b chain [Legionella steelei]